MKQHYYITLKFLAMLIVVVYAAFSRLLIDAAKVTVPKEQCK